MFVFRLLIYIGRHRRLRVIKDEVTRERERERERKMKRRETERRSNSICIRVNNTFIISH